MLVHKHRKPFPHLIIEDFYDEEELELIWEELKYYTKPGKFLDVEGFRGVVGSTNSHALVLDNIYTSPRDENSPNFRTISNILTVTRKVFDRFIIDTYESLGGCCSLYGKCNADTTKVRYYHDGEYYKSHVDSPFNFLMFSYFHKEPKKFSGGELFFPKHDYEYSCDNNSIIMFPGWVEHGVKEVSINDSDYYEGYGRYAITHFGEIWDRTRRGIK